MKTRLLALLPLLAVSAAAGAAPAPAQGGPAPLTTGSHYDRNPTVLRSGGTTQVFFARTQDECNRLAACNPDNTLYDLYLLESKPGGNGWKAPVKLADNPADPGLTFYGRTSAAAQTADGTTWVFWSNGGSFGPLYYMSKPAKSDTWSPLTQLGDYNLYFNVEVVAKGNTLFVYYEDAAGTGVHVFTFDGQTASPATLVSPGKSIPKVILDKSGTFRMAVVTGQTYPFVDAQVASSPDGLTWSAFQSVAIGDGTVTNWDASLSQSPNGVFQLFYAPDDGIDSQRIEVRTSMDFVHWSDAQALTQPDGHWDYWPEPTLGNGPVDLYYTSEAATATDAEGTGHIWAQNLGNNPKK